MVPCYHGVIGNEEANILAYSTTVLHSIWLGTLMIFRALKINLRIWIEKTFRILWFNDTQGRITKIIWANPN